MQVNRFYRELKSPLVLSFANANINRSLIVNCLKGQTPHIPDEPNLKLLVSSVEKLNNGRGRAKLHGVSFVYCNYKETGLTSQKLLENIIGQLLAQTETKNLTDECLRNLERWRPELQTGDHETFKNAYQYVAQHFERTFIIVDALDEFAEGESDRERFVAILRSFSLDTDVSILITSRPIADIEELFASDIRIEISASEADLRTFIRERMAVSNHGRLPRIVKNNEALQEQILETVVECAKGM